MRTTQRSQATDEDEISSAARKGIRHRASPNRYQDQFADPNNRITSYSLPSIKLLHECTKARKDAKKSTKPPKVKDPKKSFKKKIDQSKSSCTTVSKSRTISATTTNSDANVQPRSSSCSSSSSSSSCATSFVVKQPKPFSLNKEPYSTQESKITHSLIGTTPCSEVSDFVNEIAIGKSDLSLQLITPPTTKTEPNTTLSVKTEFMDTKINVAYLWKLIHDTNFGVYNFEKLMNHLCNLGIGDEIMFSFFMQNTDVNSEEMRTLLDCLKPWPRRAFASFFLSNSGP